MTPTPGDVSWDERKPSGCQIHDPPMEPNISISGNWAVLGTLLWDLIHRTGQNHFPTWEIHAKENLISLGLWRLHGMLACGRHMLLWVVSGASQVWVMVEIRVVNDQQHQVLYDSKLIHTEHEMPHNEYQPGPVHPQVLEKHAFILCYFPTQFWTNSIRTVWRPKRSDQNVNI